MLLAYAKNVLYDELLASDLPDQPELRSELLAYFPQAMSRLGPDVLVGHRLRREIIATTVANALVNRVGASFIEDTKARTARGRRIDRAGVPDRDGRVRAGGGLAEHRGAGQPGAGRGADPAPAGGRHGGGPGGALVPALRPVARDRARGRGSSSRACRRSLGRVAELLPESERRRSEAGAPCSPRRARRRTWPTASWR